MVGQDDAVSPCSHIFPPPPLLMNLVFLSNYLFYVILYKELELLWILVSVEGPGTSLLWILRDDWEVKSYMQILECARLGVLNPCIVQGSNGYDFLVPSWASYSLIL